ncbi:TPA: hypothetical protein HA235_06745 [Candidatus Woesearchaeota archaeon]|nr:glycosyltransferase family 39 protein [Candidatus Woesearchaeota archaeon]HIH32375.1 hypothetical protein [Candidatus Woesearchaeota archaeon]HIH54526.1 hypothetical protein [Candidatus Woesearchaeota archaeon]HIJ02252.1 hypothetical protein [Candidatus Woesearchaeota archaeon]HIJ14311.1 hypothetical protein [Candidatus Woesearchaeota archaeon]
MMRINSTLAYKLLGIFLIIFGIILPAELVLQTITKAINPNTVIMPEWIKDIIHLKIAIIFIGVVILLLSTIKLSFNKQSSKKSKTSQEFQSKINIFLIIILLLSGLIGAYYIFRPLDINIGSIYIDDYFYFLQTAKHIVSEGNLTFDGTNPTNGVQPLWLFIIVGLTAILKKDILVIIVSEILVLIMHIATAYLLYRILKLFNHATAGAILAAFWALNPFILWMNLGGLETSLNLFFISLSMLYYLKHRNSLSIKSSAILGILLGFTFLSRLDSIFFCAGIALDYLFFRTKISYMNMKRSFKELIPCGIILVIVAVVWLSISYVNTGELFPLNGKAKILTNNVGYYTGILDFIIKRAFTLLAITNQAGYFLGLWHLPGFIFSTLISGLVVGITIWLLYVAKIKVKPAIPFIMICLMLTAYYLLTSIDIRYLFPVMLFCGIGIAETLAQVFDKSTNKGIWKKIFLAIAIIFIINMGISVIAINKTKQLSGEWNPLQYTMYNEGVNWIDSTPKGTIIGSFNAGIYGYFGHRKIVNLDGVINNNAYYAMKDNRLYAYLREQNISYVIDWEYVEDFYFARFGGEENISNNLELVDTIVRDNDPHKGLRLLVYKVKYEDRQD